MTMLSEEIGRLIKNIERELLEFVKYVKTIEEEYNKLLPPTGQTSGVLDSSHHPEDDKDFPNNNGTFDAIEIAKVMVQRIYNLLDNFSNAIVKESSTVKERDSADSGCYLEKYFYNQYVCQIVAYLLKILEENLSIFSGELIQSGDAAPQQAEGRKGPLTLRFAFSKPATLFTEDGKIYQPPARDIKSLSTHRDSDRNGSSPEEYGKCDHYKCRVCFEKEKKKTLVLSNILKSLDTLFTVVEKLLFQFRNFSKERATHERSSPLYRGSNDVTPGYEAKTGKEADHLLKKYIRFCESCSSLLKNPKSVQLYKEYKRENRILPKTHYPPIYDKLSQMEKREQQESPGQCEEDASPRNKHIPGNSFAAGKGSLKEKGMQDPTSGAAVPRRERKTRSTEKKSLSAVKLRSCVSNSATNLPSGSREEQEIAALQTKLFSPQKAFPARRLFASKGTSTSQEETDESSSSENDEEDTAYPQTVLFDVKKFSHLLKEKFKKTEGRSKSKELLDIVISSMKESSDFKYEAAGRKDGKISRLEGKTATADDVKVKADKAVDALVDDVIRVAAKIMASSMDLSRTLRPQEKGIQAEEEEHITWLPTTGSQEFAKALYREQFELNKKFPRVTPACISCLNMEESITTDSPRKSSSKKVDERRSSLTGTCFQCYNACQRGLTIHQCHYTLPSRVLEIRHMDDSARVLVCFLKWDITKEPEDWRWQKNPFPDPTRVEVQQPATRELDPVLKVVYGPEATMLKESFGETRLRIIRDFPKTLHHMKRTETVYDDVVKSDSMTAFKGQKISKKAGLRHKKPDIGDISGYEVPLVNKLGRFYDDVQRFGYGRGPPLILKLRRNHSLKDAYNLLMAPSKIRLHYYRNLRVIFVSHNNTKQIISKSNFVEEDESNGLFEHFARKLFGTEDYHLFDYPSDEAHYMYLNPETQTHPQWFTFAGTVLALALLHQKKMDIKLSSCLFKCLLDRPLVIGDLQSIDPLLYQRLMWIKQNDLSSRKAKMSFVVRDKVGSKTIDQELMLNGKNIAVTEKNKFRYIELAVKWKLAERCLTQLKDFRSGFASVVDPCFLSIFKENEIVSIIKQPPEYQVWTPESASSAGLTRRGTW